MIALLVRDLKLAIRAGGGFGLAIAFFLIVIVLVPLGVGPEMVILSKIASGVLWLGALLACLLSLDRIFALDHEDGTLDLLVTAPLPLEAVIMTKALAHWILQACRLLLWRLCLLFCLVCQQMGIYGSPFRFYWAVQRSV